MMNKRIWVIIPAVLVTLLPAKVKNIMTKYRYGNTMGDNREEAYLQNPLSKTSRLLKLLPNGADILRHMFTFNFSAIFHFCKLVSGLHFGRIIKQTWPGLFRRGGNVLARHL